MMSLNVEKYYDLLSDSVIGIIIDNVTKNDETSSLLLLSEVNLYYQPVETVPTASLFFLIRLTLVIVAEITNIQLFLQINKETCLVKDVTKVYTCTQIVFIPIWLCFNTSTDFLHPLNEIIGPWFCHTGWFLVHFGGTIIAFYSFIVSVMRYYFIVHDERVDKRGKKKAERIFFWLILVIPLVMVLWEATNGSDLDVMSAVNKCYGKDHKIFLIEESTSAVFKNKFCEYDTHDDTNDSFGQVFAFFRRVSCITNKLFLVLTSLNVAEGVVYYRVLVHLNR